MDAADVIRPEVWARGGRRTELAPGALDVLRMLGPDRVVVLLRADGRRERWQVREVVPAEGPTIADSIEVDDAADALTLTVCGGPYDPGVGGYLRSLVIRCAPAEVLPAAS